MQRQVFFLHFILSFETELVEFRQLIIEFRRPNLSSPPSSEANSLGQRMPGGEPCCPEVGYQYITQHLGWEVLESPVQPRKVGMGAGAFGHWS